MERIFAKSTLREYWEKYPDTEMATQVELLISMLGKNEDQILEMLQQKNDSIQ